MTEESRHLEKPPLERFDETTGETTNRGNAILGDPMNIIRRAEVRSEREAAWDDYCFRANVLIHGYDYAKRLWDNVHQPWPQE